jgi:hypothetical protein
MAKRIRIMTNTVQGALDMAAALSKQMVSPIKLRMAENKIFKGVIEQREAASWTQHDLRLAALLAKSMHRLDELGQDIEREGSKYRTTEGVLRANPDLASYNALGATIGRFNLMLGLSANQRGLSGAIQDKRNVADRKARAAITKASGEEELI